MRLAHQSALAGVLLAAATVEGRGERNFYILSACLPVRGDDFEEITFFFGLRGLVQQIRISGEFEEFL